METDGNAEVRTVTGKSGQGVIRRASQRWWELGTHQGNGGGLRGRMRNGPVSVTSSNWHCAAARSTPFILRCLFILCTLHLPRDSGGTPYITSLACGDLALVAWSPAGWSISSRAAQNCHSLSFIKIERVGVHPVSCNFLHRVLYLAAAWSHSESLLITNWLVRSYTAILCRVRTSCTNKTTTRDLGVGYLCIFICCSGQSLAPGCLLSTCQWLIGKPRSLSLGSLTILRPMPHSTTLNLDKARSRQRRVVQQLSTKVTTIRIPYSTRVRIRRGQCGLFLAILAVQSLIDNGINFFLSFINGLLQQEGASFTTRKPDGIRRPVTMSCEGTMENGSILPSSTD
ncbi:hypothetical protein QBC37DRAFT_396140 [Rhypophila decipiens]|uniref:Uncharacterized protein n=1 Tax=Rhypophila decipiens TaxID=261697 RepID=A0AAN7BCC9_9PEZI|nr:hypothetical protein QBC37DRAFT_396140 [Rhypophila decipiens]